MLFYRSGTLYEDMYWLALDTGDIAASALVEKEEEDMEEVQVHEKYKAERPYIFGQNKL